jgi:hypothetical protein
MRYVEERIQQRRRRKRARAIRVEKKQAQRESLRRRCWVGDRHSGHDHNHFAPILASSKNNQRNRPRYPSTGRRRRRCTTREGHSITPACKCRGYFIKGGPTSRRGTSRKARGNVHDITNPARRTAVRRRAARKADALKPPPLALKLPLYCSAPRV